MKNILVLLCGLVRFAVSSSVFSTPIVEIEQGKLRGMKSPLSGINQYFSVPYASSKRFKPPQEPKKWTGIFDATQRIRVCAQMSTYVLTVNEDCQFLDVFTPEHAKPGDKIPVFIFIHGGGFYFGSKTIYNPEFLVTKNIVAVIIDYRLNALGFLCVNGVANLGLKDQNAALRWVHKNIAAFGGDPDHVTLAGQSAGAISTSFHMLSEQSAGLFHKAILFSGFALAPWAFNLVPVKTALTDANKIGVAHTEMEIYKVFSKAPIVELLKATRAVFYNTSAYRYSPCVDSHLSDPFFRDTPYEIIKSGRFYKVPVLMGVTDREGIMFYGTNNRSTLAEWDENFVGRLPTVFSWCSKNDRERIAHEFRAHYFGELPIDSDKAVPEAVQFYIDWLDHTTFDAFSSLLAEKTGMPLYKYIFSYEGDRNIPKIVFGGAASRLKGASHTDDMAYLFKPLGIPLLLSRKDKMFIDRYTTMIANFIKYTNPTPHHTALLPVHWPSSTSRNSYIMHLDHKLKVTKGPLRKDPYFLKQLCKYGQQGYVPCESQMQCYPGENYEQRVRNPYRNVEYDYNMFDKGKYLDYDTYG